jgi:hypothetical protein
MIDVASFYLRPLLTSVPWPPIPDPRPLIPDQIATSIPDINLLISFAFKIEEVYGRTFSCASCTIFCAKRTGKSAGKAKRNKAKIFSDRINRINADKFGR